MLYVAAAAALAAAAFLPLPYYAVGPGPVREVTPLIIFEEMPRYEPSGKVVLTTVRLYQVSPFLALRAWLDPDWTVVPTEDIYPEGTTVEMEARRAISDMDRSKIDAAYVALRELNVYPEQHEQGALIESTIPGCPADGVLFSGDVITHIDGEPIQTRREASRLIQATEQGDSLEFEVNVDGKTETVTFVREKCLEGEDQELVGVVLLPVFPFEVSISNGEVGGSSAGLMWAVGFHDLLTPEDLTQGRMVAGTGMIDLAGNVYPIGGIRDKLVAARDAGADIFLIPEENAAEIEGVDIGDMELVQVSTFSEALEALGVLEAASQA